MRKKAPSIKQIASYWELNGDALRGNECLMGADCVDWEDRCWCCGFETKLERCHIIPHSLGGSSEPSNFVLLCESCHIEAPNVNDEYSMWEYIKENRNIFYFSKEEIDFIKKEIEKHIGNVSNHFGRKINKSTISYIEKNVSKSFVSKFLQKHEL